MVSRAAGKETVDDLEHWMYIPRAEYLNVNGPNTVLRIIASTHFALRNSSIQELNVYTKSTL